MKMKKFALKGLIILAAAVALCIFFSGTIRSLTTPKVRFAQAKMGKMEQETELKGTLVFPKEEEIRMTVPEGVTLTVSRVYAAAGDRVKSGEKLFACKVTDGEKTLENLRKDAAAARKEMRELEQKTKGLRLTPGEQRWQEAWLKDNAAWEAEQQAKVNLQAALRQEGLSLTEDGKLPEEASGEETEQLYRAWTEAKEVSEAAAAELSALERYAIEDDTWNNLQKLREQEEKLASLEEQITNLQVLAQTAAKVTSPRKAYVSKVNVEKGSTVDSDTVVMNLTAKGNDPVIRVDLSEVKQEVKEGASITLFLDDRSSAVSRVTETGLTAEGRPYADVEITEDVTYSLGSIAVLMKAEIRAKLIIRSRDTTCLMPAAAIRGSGDSRYVYVGETESSTFGGNQIRVRKMSVTVLAESGSTVSVAEDLSNTRVLYMEDRALTEDAYVMEYQ